MVLLQLHKTVYIELEHKLVSVGTVTTVEVAPSDKLSLDAAGVEFEHQASGKRRFIPWTEIKEIWQPLD
jgi:hypothetical protein